jgi:hypothetical protein
LSDIVARHERDAELLDHRGHRHRQAVVVEDRVAELVADHEAQLRRAERLEQRLDSVSTVGPRTSR